MRSTITKLSLVAVAVLLAHCAVPTDDGPVASQGGEVASGGDDVAEGLLAFRTVKPSGRLRGKDPVADALAYVTTAAESAGARSPEFSVVNVAKDVDGLTHVRLQQTHQGMPVFGADSVVHVSDTEVVGASGHLATRLTPVQLLRSLSPEAALAKAKADRYGSQPVVTERESVETIVRVKADGAPEIALHTSFFNELQGEVEPALWNHLIDAATGEVITRWNELHSEQASGPGGNPKFVWAWNQELDVVPTATGYVMTTPQLKTVDMKTTSSTATEVTMTSLENVADAPLNDAHGYAEFTLRMLKEWFGRNSINDNGFVIVSRVHYGRSYENAFWDGRQMTYGDGKNRFYPLSGAIDVVSHEIHHGFTNFHSRLVYRGQPGGLNEGFSDIAGTVAEFFFKATPDFDMGGDVFKAPNAALRYMCDPKKDGRSIDNAANMTSSMDPHYSSGVPNKAFCRAAKRFSAAGDPEGGATREGVQRAASAFFLANAQYWTSSTTFVQGCQGTLDAARALGFTTEEVDFLKSSWSDVGVTCN